MSLRSEIIQKWWPSTQSLDLAEGSVEAVAAALQAEVTRFVQGEALATSWEKFPNLDCAFHAASEFANVPTVYLVLPTRSKWSVLWNNSSLCDGYDSLCWCLTMNHGLATIHWAAHDAWTSFQSGATFVHRRRSAGEIIERAVQAGQTDNRWDFIQTGEPLPEEDLQGYKARLKQDRFNEERVTALLARLEATPWQEKFYALPERHAFVLRRKNPPATVGRCSVDDVIRRGKHPTQREWMKQTVEQSIIASLQRQISPDDLPDAQWLQFKDKMQDGDELWAFRTPQETWTEFVPRCGMEGYALIRGNTVVAEIFTSMS